MARWLGIDLGAESVRVALTVPRYRGLAIEALREERYDAHESQAAALRTAVTGLRFDGVAVGLDGGRAFVRLLNLPSAAGRELSSVLAFEVEATLPFELDDGVMDHRVLRAVAGLDPPGTLPILAGVASAHDVRQCIELVKHATGTEPVSVGIGALPLCNLVPHLRGVAAGGYTALLEFAETHTDFLVLHGGEPRLCRTLSRGMRGLPATAQVWARELRQTLAAWRARGGPPLGEVYALGPGREMQGLAEFLLAETGLALRPLPQLALEKPRPGIEASVGLFAKAIGLGLGLGRRSGDLNLRRGSLAVQESYSFLREKTPLLAGLGAAIVVSFGFSVFAELRALSTERTALENELAQVTKQVLGEETRSIEHAEDLLDEALSGKSDDPMPELDAYDVLLELSGRIPKEIVHDIAEFDFNRGNVTLQGIVPSVGDAETIRKKMAEHACFRDAKVTRTAKMGTAERQKYVLELSVKCGAGDKDEEAQKKDAAGDGDGRKTGAADAGADK
ncbi:MAG: general secretion pathway protein GspL [Myxococcales bacterium]|nr:general secretion pathway protein GspL [Myxococcales bacterium]